MRNLTAPDKDPSPKRAEDETAKSKRPCKKCEEVRRQALQIVRNALSRRNKD